MRQRHKLLVVSGGRFSQEIFWILTPERPLPWVSESFRWDIGQISTWKLFFITKNIFIMENLTDLRKTVETSVDLCSWTRVDNLMIQGKFFPFAVVQRCYSEIMNIRETYNNRTCRMKRIKQISRHNFCSCEKKPKTIEACVGFKNLTSAIPVQCPTNWFTCNKPTGSRSLSRSVMSPWKDDDEIP